MVELYHAFLTRDWDVVEEIINEEMLRKERVRVNPPKSLSDALFSEENFVERMMDEAIRRGAELRSEFLIFVRAIFQWLRLCKRVLGEKPSDEILISIFSR